MAISVKTRIIHTTSDLFFIFSQWLVGHLNFQLNQTSSFEVIGLDSRASKKIDLYSNHTDFKLQVFTFLAINLDTLLGFSLKYSPVIDQSSKL